MSDERIVQLRPLLSDLSRFMRCLNKPTARRANAEGHVTGRYWEGRSRCQQRLVQSLETQLRPLKPSFGDQGATLLAITQAAYVDLAAYSDQQYRPVRPRCAPMSLS